MELLKAVDSWPYLAEARNWSKAQVRVGEWPVGSGKTVVAKDIRQQPFWFRLLYTRHTLKREWDALIALKDVEFVPHALERPSPDLFLMEQCPGEEAHELPEGAELDEFLHRLDDLIAQVHVRGVTHGDLHRDNILRAPDGTVSLIDWATASVYGPRPFGLKKWLFVEFRALDLRAVAKIKARHATHLLTESEKELLAGGGSPAYRLIKQFRTLIRLALRREVGGGVDYKKIVEENKAKP